MAGPGILAWVYLSQNSLFLHVLGCTQMDRMVISFISRQCPMRRMVSLGWKTTLGGAAVNEEVEQAIK